MAGIAKFTIQELLESGAHFGHKRMRWNPKMAPYIYDSRNEVHIINLQKTAPLLHRALNVILEVAKNNGRILFVGTKRQASSLIADSAKRCGQYYVNHRWLGGMLTNLDTIAKSIKTLKNLEETISNTEENSVFAKFTKKEKLDILRQADKLEKSLGGIRDMGARPDLIFVIDTNKEHIAIEEAKKLGIPVVAIVDTNSNPEAVDYPIPANDDATRAIKLYCKLVSDTILSGMQESFTKSGVDLGESEDGMDAELLMHKSEVKKNHTKKKTVSLKHTEVQVESDK
jgi:small subunit ribosomal protein S2